MVLLDPIGDRSREDFVIVCAAEAASIDVLRLGAAARAADHVRRDLLNLDVGIGCATFAEIQLEVGIPDLDGHVNWRIGSLALRTDQEAITPCSLRSIYEEGPVQADTAAEVEQEPWRSEQASEEGAWRQMVGQEMLRSEEMPSSCSAEAEALERKSRRR